MIAAASFAAAWAAARLLTPRYASHLAGAGFSRENYLGERLPTAAGVFLLLGAVPGWSLLALAGTPNVLPLSAAAAIVAMAGWFDDAAGDGSRRGLAGHLRALSQGVWTTGALKAYAAAGAAAALLAASGGAAGAAGLLDFLLLLLATNAFNLIDLRPGRAVTAYIALTPLLLAYAWRLETLGAQLPVLGASVALRPFDARRALMLGDTGSNLLGLCFGWAAVCALPLAGRAAAVLLLAALHVVADRFSLSAWIDRRGGRTG